jgi:2-oxoglutarate ferredoxin oxidoreductase subunit delta
VYKGVELMAHIEIDEKKCKACYLCIKECPKKLITKSENANSLGAFPVTFKDENKECLGCAICATRCPDITIKVYK